MADKQHADCRLAAGHGRYAALGLGEPPLQQRCYGPRLEQHRIQEAHIGETRSYERSGTLVE